MPVDMATVSTLVGMESIPMEDMVTMASTLEAILPVVLETLLELEATRLILVRTSNCSIHVCMCAVVCVRTSNCSMCPIMQLFTDSFHFQALGTTILTVPMLIPLPRLKVGTMDLF